MHCGGHCCESNLFLICLYLYLKSLLHTVVQHPRTQLISLQLWNPILTLPQWGTILDNLLFNESRKYMDLNVWNWTPRKFLWCMVELWRGVNSKLFCTQQAAGSSENTNTQIHKYKMHKYTMHKYTNTNTQKAALSPKKEANAYL